MLPAASADSAPCADHRLMMVAPLKPQLSPSALGPVMLLVAVALWVSVRPSPSAAQALVALPATRPRTLRPTSLPQRRARTSQAPQSTLHIPTSSGPQAEAERHTQLQAPKETVGASPALRMWHSAVTSCAAALCVAAAAVAAFWGRRVLQRRPAQGVGGALAPDQYMAMGSSVGLAPSPSPGPHFRINSLRATPTRLGSTALYSTNPLQDVQSMLFGGQDPDPKPKEFDYNTALLAAGFTFETYSEPTGARWERGSQGCNVAFVSDEFTSTIYNGLLVVTVQECNDIEREQHGTEKLVSGDGSDVYTLWAIVEDEDDVKTLEGKNSLGVFHSLSCCCCLSHSPSASNFLLSLSFHPSPSPSLALALAPCFFPRRHSGGNTLTPFYQHRLVQTRPPRVFVLPDSSRPL